MLKPHDYEFHPEALTPPRTTIGFDVKAAATPLKKAKRRKRSRA